MRLMGRLHDETGRSYEVDMNVTPNLPAAVHTLYGINCTPGELAQVLQAYPGMQYQRDFGKGKPPALTTPGTGRLAELPPTVTPHVSFKLWDAFAFELWLNTLNRPVYLTYWHEPMGDIEPGLYRQHAQQMARIIDSHKNGHLVLHHGPVVTRYWLDEAQGNKMDWWYDGATAFFADCYSPDGQPYLAPEDMFDLAAAAARDLEVPWGVPEFGAKRYAADTTGAKRTAWMEACMVYLAEQTDCLCVAWWNFLGGWHLDQYANAPEKAYWQNLLRNQSP